MKLRSLISLSLSILALHLAGCDDSKESKSTDSRGDLQSPVIEAPQPRANPEELSQLAELEEALAEANTGRDQGKALYPIIKFLSELGRDAEVLARGAEYIALNPRLLTHKGPVILKMANASENLGEIEEAITRYDEIVNLHTGRIEISAPAALRTAELRWERNLPEEVDRRSDRQRAYEILHRYLHSTKHLYPKFREGERADWDRLKPMLESYGSHPDTVPMPR